MMDMGSIWENGRNNDKNVWIRKSKRCADKEWQDVESSMRGGSSLIHCVNSFRSNGGRYVGNYVQEKPEEEQHDEKEGYED
jgi:hypothetical protein